MSASQAYYENYGDLSVADYVERFVRGSAAEMERMRAMVALVPPDTSTLLDVGAGHGVFLEELRLTRGVVGTGVEITQAKVDYARSRGLDLRLGDASALPFPDASFDTVVCCEVLEHLPFGTYEAACRELARLAARCVVVSVPYRERRHFVRCPYCGAAVNPNYHFRSFDEGVLRGLLPGFEIERTLALGREAHGVLKSWLRPLLSRGWPALLVCPSCGWRRPAGAPARASQGPSWLHVIGGAIPSPSRPSWLVGVYRRPAR
jgi:cyclopropane fatty-acyl-phospholipid synthase-like methyltransferase